MHSLRPHHLRPASDPARYFDPHLPLPTLQSSLTPKPAPPPTSLPRHLLHLALFLLGSAALGYLLAHGLHGAWSLITRLLP